MASNGVGSKVIRAISRRIVRPNVSRTNVKLVDLKTVKQISYPTNGKIA